MLSYWQSQAYLTQINWRKIMKEFFAGVATTLIVLAAMGYVYVMTPPWVKKDMTDRAAVTIGRQVVEKYDCGEIVEAQVYEKPRRVFPPEIFTWYTNQIVLADGRTRTFDSSFIYKVGGTHCIFWTEYVK